MGSQHPPLETLDFGQPFGLDILEAPEVACKRVRIPFDARAAQVFEEIIVGMHAVEVRVRRMRLVEIPEEVVDKM
jgi:hypothetical protein